MPLTAHTRTVRLLTADARFTDVIYNIPNENFRGDILTLTGGGATALDGIVTTIITPPYVVNLSMDDDRKTFKLRARTGADPLPASGDPLLGTAFVYPLDYDDLTNDVVWVRIS